MIISCEHHLPARAIVTYSESDLWAHLIGAVFTLLMLIICTVEDSGGCVGACWRPWLCWMEEVR
jgi:hypothetical protein